MIVFIQVKYDEFAQNNLCKIEYLLNLFFMLEHEDKYTFCLLKRRIFLEIYNLTKLAHENESYKCRRITNEFFRYPKND